VGPRAILDAVVKRKIPNPRRESNSKILIIQTVAQSYKMKFAYFSSRPTWISLVEFEGDPSTGPVSGQLKVTTKILN
jgi:hypothetical protein